MSDIEKSLSSVFTYFPQYLSFQQWHQPFVGAQAAVRIDGNLVFNHAVGYADLAGEVPLTVNHLFRIASHSKTFTGVACLQLVESGKLRLDDRAGDLVPELSDCAMAGVTVRELLSHGSGMIRDGKDSTWWSLDKRFPNRAELLEVIRNDGKVIEPNTHLKYSNIGYSLLGLIIEAASGQDYRDYTQQHIVEPLGLNDTGPDLNIARLADLAKGYTTRAHGPQRREIEHIDTYSESAATGFYSTASDLTAYFQAHLDGNAQILTDASKRMMRQVQWTAADGSSYGLGLSIDKIADRTYYGHSGGYPGHITISYFDLERGLSLSILTNANDGPAAQLADALIKLIDLALKEKPKSEQRQSEALARFEGRFATLWGVTDIVNLGGHLYMLNPSSPNPAGLAVELDVLSQTELDIVGDGGYGGFGERMNFTFRDDGSIVEIWGGGGQRLVPIADFVLPDRITRPT